MYFIYLSMSDLLIFITSYTDKHEFSCIWMWNRCNTDIMNNVDWIIKCDGFPQKIHSCSKNILGISSFVPKISLVY